MKMNWKTFKIITVFIVIIGIVFWVINATLPRSYDGTALDFEVGSGATIVTNSSEQSIPVQFIDAGARNFGVRSDIEGVSGNSTREGSGSNATILFEFELPSGTSEFFITRGTNPRFVASSPSALQATVNPMNAEEARTAIIIVIVIILGLLFYASNVIEHSWIGVLRGKDAVPQDPEPNPVLPSAQGRTARSFGDNRAKSED